MSKQDKTIIFVIIAVVTILVIGSTFAYFTWVSNTSQKTTVSFTSGAGFSCSANGGGNITNTDIYLAPTTCTDTTRAIKRTVTVSPTITQNDGDIYLNMWLKVNSIGSGLSASNNFKYALTTDGTSCTSGTVVAQGNFNGAAANDQIPLLEDKAYSQTTTDTYYLWIWLDAAETSSDTQGQTFNLALGGSCSNAAPAPIPKLLSQTAAMDNVASTYVTASTGVDFNVKSSDTNGKGLYIRAGTENDAYPIYYYRGAVTDNNVLFAGFCWKIVRTTSTGGTKLIYNGVSTGANHDKCENTTGTATQLTYTKAFNNTGNSPADVGYMYGEKYPSQSVYMRNISDTYMYATGYDEVNHRLVTTGAMNFAGTSWGTYYNQLNNNNYTCFNTTGECEDVQYVYATDSTTAYALTMPLGKTIDEVLAEMTTNSSNTNSSVIKTAIDTWYAANMMSYTSKLEDTPYCNDRSTPVTGAWSQGGSTTTPISFGSYYRIHPNSATPSLACNSNDAFTVSSNNGNGKLTYPVGLLTADEVRIAGGKHNSINNTFYLYTNQKWWTISPEGFNGTTFGFYISETGEFSSYGVYKTCGVRPVVSLKSGTRFASGGDGTTTNPYVVE